MATGWENLITGSSSITTTSSTTSSTKSSLSNDDFLQLLLTELQYQDPTDPMDSDKILTQTAQLSSLEAAQNTTAALESLSEQLASNTNFSAIGVIGQMASLGSSAITLKDKASNFEIYFPSEIKTGTLTITDTDGKTVKTIDISSSTAGKSGVVAFNWDGVNNDGTQLADGTYSATVTYTDADGNLKTTQAGTYPVESVRYIDGEAYVKLGSYYYAIDEVLEFYDKSLA